MDFERGTIRWRAEADKKRKEWTVPIPAPLLEELRQARIKLGAVGGWTDTETLLNCYQQADPTTMLAVMSEPTKVRELVAQR